MEHVKKMILVPSETIARLQEKNVAPTPTDKISQLDHEMEKVLQENGNEEEKWKRYEQLLQRCMHFVNEQRKPFRITLPPGTVNEDVSPPNPLRSELERIMPKTMKANSVTLYDRLVPLPGIKWNDSGAITIGDTEFPDSNIIDLISDVVRSRKTAHAKAWREFAQALAKSNVPIDLIRNTMYKRVIREQKGEGIASIIRPNSNEVHSKNQELEGRKVGKGRRRLDKGRRISWRVY